MQEHRLRAVQVVEPQARPAPGRIGLRLAHRDPRSWQAHVPGRWPDGSVCLHAPPQGQGVHGRDGRGLHFKNVEDGVKKRDARLCDRKGQALSSARVPTTWCTMSPRQLTTSRAHPPRRRPARAPRIRFRPVSRGRDRRQIFGQAQVARRSFSQRSTRAIGRTPSERPTAKEAKAAIRSRVRPTVGISLAQAIRSDFVRRRKEPASTHGRHAPIAMALGMTRRIPQGRADANMLRREQHALVEGRQMFCNC